MTLSRLSSLAAMFALVLLMVFPAVAAAQSPVGDERGVLFGVRDDLTLDAGSSASVVVAVQGHVTIAGHARVVFMVDGTVELQGTSASVDTLVAVRAHVKLGPGTTVGTLRALDSTVDQDPTATVTDTKDLQGSMVVLVGVLGTFLALLLLGWAVAVLVVRRGARSGRREADAAHGRQRLQGAAQGARGRRPRLHRAADRRRAAVRDGHRHPAGRAGAVLYLAGCVRGLPGHGCLAG